MTAVGTYARAVERCWSQLVGAPGVLSPREWRLVLEWHERGVPLQIIREAIEAAAERRTSKPPRGLAYIAAAVDEAWNVVQDGRLVEDGMGPAPEPARAEARWLARAEAEAPGSELGRLLRSLLDRLRRNAPRDVIDGELNSRLADTLPAERVEAASRQVEQELARFLRRMPAPAFAATSRRALVDRLRQELDLPPL